MAQTIPVGRGCCLSQFHRFLLCEREVLGAAIGQSRGLSCLPSRLASGAELSLVQVQLLHLPLHCCRQWQEP